MRARWNVVGMATVLMATGLAVSAPLAGATDSGAALVVDDDGAQCPDAQFSSIGSAIGAARSGDTILVCGGTYGDRVTITKRVKLEAKVPAAAAIECLSAADAPVPADLAVVTGGMVASADRVEIDGLLVAGQRDSSTRTPIGITTDERYSGYRIRRTVVQDTGRFGIELQSSGALQTVVEKNCLRRNGIQLGDRAGLVSESGALRNALIRKNQTAENFEAISVAGPHPHSNISITDNVSRREGIGVFVSGVVSGEVSRNDIENDGSPVGVIGIGGGNIGLVVDANSVVGGVPAISVNRNANVTNPGANVGIVISRNRITDSGSGINITFPEVGAQPNLTRSLLYRNEVSGGRNSGILIASGNNDNVLVGNRSRGNARFGIWLAAVPGLPVVSGTVAVGNTMLDNLAADARDDSRDQNTWIDNRCVTQLPMDANICHADATARTDTPAVARGATSARIPVIPPAPAVDQAGWPCLKVPVWDVDPVDGGAWVRITVVAPDAPADTVCA